MNPVIAVVGADFSGSMAALQLLSALPRSWSVLPCGKTGSFGRGLAYGTDAPAHLLNLRAASMSAFPERPEPVSTWLSGVPEDEWARFGAGHPSPGRRGRRPGCGEGRVPAGLAGRTGEASR